MPVGLQDIIVPAAQQDLAGSGPGGIEMARRNAFRIGRAAGAAGEKPRPDIRETDRVLVDRLMPQRRSLSKRLQPCLQVKGQASAHSVEKAVGAQASRDRPSPRMIFADLEGGPIVPLKIPRPSLVADRAAAIVEKGSPMPARSSRLTVSMSTRNPACGPTAAKRIVNAVALVVAEEDRIAGAASADIDGARRVGLVATEDRFVQRMRQSEGRVAPISP